MKRVERTEIQQREGVSDPIGILEEPMDGNDDQLQSESVSVEDERIKTDKNRGIMDTRESSNNAETIEQGRDLKPSENPILVEIVLRVAIRKLSEFKADNFKRRIQAYGIEVLPKINDVLNDKV
jgi:hypothetical protein